MDLTNLNKERKSRRKSGSLELGTIMFGKVPPQAKDLEEAVLGAIMIEKNAFDIVIEILKPECFYTEPNQRIFRAMQGLQQKNSPIDLLTVVEELKFREELDLVGGPFYVTKLTNSVVSSANIETHARIILQKFIQRELIRISGEIINDAYEESTDVFDLLDDAESKLFEITNNHLRKDYASIDTVLVKTIQRIEDLRTRQDEITGVPTGFRVLDHLTYGWQPSDLIILAARPSVGKTAFALNLARNAALHPAKPTAVGFFSLEMSAGQLVQRILSAESEIWLEKIARGKLEEHEMQQLYKKGIQKLASAPIHIDDKAALNIFELRAKCRRLKNKHNVGIIIIDYLQLMSGTGENRNSNREQEISRISRDLKGLAKELQIPIIALSQLSREVEKRKEGSKMPQLSDLRESGAIEQDADMVMFLYRPEYYEITANEMGESNKGETHVRIAKHRNGQLDTIKLRAVLEFQRFEDDGSLEGGGGGMSNPYAGMRSQGNEDAKVFIQKGSKMNDMNFDDEGLEDAPF
ncbi:MAG TPA: replicative DNA helicase [Candidatus Babeliaceae bacterium]|nr:replicative DNA helicase [Candidatus Babeliaceae bacterium]